MFRCISLSAFLLIGVGAVPASAQPSSAAEIERCQMMAATLKPKKNEMESLMQKRDLLSVEVETLGDTWESDEEERLFNAQAGMQADASKSAYDKAKGDLINLERGLQANGKQFNRDIADYNRSCAAN